MIRWQVKLIFIILINFFLINVAAAAKTVYVVEKTKINLRSGPGYEYKIISLLSSGEELRIVNEFETWYKIQVNDESESKKEGWILKSLVKEEKPMTMQITALKETLASMESELNELKKENKELSENKQDLESINQDQTSALKSLNTKYEKVVNSYVIKWVIVGASILLLGIIMGTMYESIKHRHRPGLRL